MEIRKEDIINSRFIKFVKRENINANAYYGDKYFIIKTPSREDVQKFHLRTLCIFIGVDTLRFRDIDGAVKNANYWLKKSKAEILEAFFNIF